MENTLQCKRSLRLRAPLLLVLGLILLSVAAYAQGGGTITGMVTDQTGAAIANAKVTLTNQENGFIRNTQTNETGAFMARDLGIGTYKIHVEAKGFKAYDKTSIRLTVGDTVRADAMLQVGGQQEVVTVEANAIQVQSGTSDVSQTVTDTQVSQLATNGRNVLQLSALVAGVSSTMPDFDTPVAQYQNRNVQFNGQRQDHNNWMIGGGEAYDRGGGGILIVAPSQDAIQEFKVTTSNYAADLGGSSGGMITMAIKPGTKSYHGMLWEYNRNDALNAYSWNSKNRVDPENAVKEKLRYNAFGFNFGGPMNPKAKDPKTFFFFNMEWRRLIQKNDSTQRALTAAQRDGSGGVYDLSGLLKAGTTIHVPTVLSAAEQARWLAANPAFTPGAVIPNATIPASLVDPNAQAFLATGNFPLANAESQGNPVYKVNADQVDNYREETIRIDRQFSDKLTVMGHLIWDNGIQKRATPLWQGMTYPTVGTDAKVPSWTGVVHATYTMSPTLLMEVSYNTNGNNLNIDPSDRGGTYVIPSGWTATQFFPDVNQINKLPSLNAQQGDSGSFGMNYDIGRWPWRNTWRSYQLKDDLSWSRGTHNFRFGAGWMWTRKMQPTDANRGGNYTFNGQATGMGYADFLLGYASSYQQPQVWDAVHIAFNNISLYAMDDWKVNKRLTLNLGLRWEGLPPSYDQNQRLSNFYPNLYDPAQAGTFVGSNSLDPTGPGFTTVSGIPLSTLRFYMNGIGLAGRDGIPKGMVDHTWKTFAPRVGFAFDLTGSGKTILRAGVGTFYERTAGNEYYNMMNNVPFLYTPSVANVLLRDPNINYQTGADSTSSYPIAGITGVALKHDVPTTNMWNLGIQHDIAGKAVLDVSYVGNSSYHLTDTIPINNLAENDPNRRQLCGGSCGPGLNPNPFRPYQGWAAINVVENMANSNYNSMQVSVRTTSWKDLTLSANWTWAHGFDMVDGELWNNLVNPVDKRYNYGTTGFDRRHVVNIAYVYRMPFFRHSDSKLVRAMAGGWTISGVTMFFAGTPLTINNPGSDILGYGGNTTNLVDKVSPVTYPKTRDAWFSTDSFAQVTTPLTWGNSGRSSVIGPGRNNWNVALFKNFAITERAGFEFRAESFNTFNHTQFTTVESNFASNNFGKITAAAPPRIFQLGARLTF